jgi:BRCT domain type II-containing protein
MENEIKQEEPKDNFFKRIGRGFKVLIGKMQGIANNMAQANKQETKKEENKNVSSAGLSGMDMSYAPQGL